MTLDEFFFRAFIVLLAPLLCIVQDLPPTAVSVGFFVWAFIDVHNAALKEERERRGK